MAEVVWRRFEVIDRVPRVPPDWGGPLTEADHESLEKSWISRELADLAMLRRVTTEEGREVVGQKGKRDRAGLLIPGYRAGESRPHRYRIRRDNPEWKLDKDGNLKPDRKYLGAPGAANRLYIRPGVTSGQLQDADIPFVVVEGGKKAVALWRLANRDTETPRFIPIRPLASHDPHERHNQRFGPIRTSGDAARVPRFFALDLRQSVARLAIAKR